MLFPHLSPTQTVNHACEHVRILCDVTFSTRFGNFCFLVIAVCAFCFLPLCLLAASMFMEIANHTSIQILWSLVGHWPQCLREFVNKINIACKYFSISFSSQACLCMSFPMKNHSSMLTSNVCVNRELFELARKFSNSFPHMVRKRFVSMILHVE